jgi:hypothetical protein
MGGNPFRVAGNRALNFGRDDSATCHSRAPGKR